MRALKAPEPTTAFCLAGLALWATLSTWVEEPWAAGAFRGGALLLGAAWSAFCIAEPRRLRAAPTLALLWAVPLWAGVQLLSGWTASRQETMEAALVWLALASLAAVGFGVFEHERLRRLFLTGFAAAASLLSLQALLQLFLSNGKVFWLFGECQEGQMGPFPNWNHFATFILLAWPATLYAAFRHPKYLHLGLGAAAVQFAAVVACASRAGSALLAAEALTVLVLLSRRRAARPANFRAACLQGGVLIAAFVLLAGPEKLWLRYMAADPLGHRREILASTLELAAEKPLTGHGVGAFQTVYPAVARFDIGLYVNHAHNDWLEWLATGGVPMLAMLLALAAAILWPALRSIWGAGLIFAGLHAMLDYPFQRPGVSAWAVLLIAAVLARAGQDRGP